jgi:hypothetical protein
MLTGYTAKAATLNVSTTTLNAGHNQREITVRITSDIDWDVSENISWLNCNHFGSGNQTLDLNLDANTTLTQRSGTITISGAGVTSKTITITQSGVTSDIYETNNTEATAYNTNFTFDNDIAVIYIDEASIHNNTDADYYKLNLPSGYTYKVSPELFTSSNYESTKYSINAIFSRKIENGSWSSTSEDILTDFISTGGNIYFKIQAKTSGEYGAYGLKIILSRGTGTPTISAAGSVLLNAGANSTDISITSNTNWNIVNSENNIAWLNLNATSGSNNGSVTVSAEKNNSLSNRSATLLLSANGALSQSIDVIQSGIDLADDSYETNETEATAKELTVTFTNDMARVITNDALISNANDMDFYKIFLPEGSTYSISGVLHDRFENNELVDARVYYKIGSNSWSSSYDSKIEDFTYAGGDFIYFKVVPYFTGNKGKYSLDLLITRDIANPNLTISSPTLSIAANDNSSNTFAITSNSGWKITTYDSWLKVNQESGWGDATITVTAIANVGLDPRDAYITISCPTLENDSITVTQSAEGLPKADSYETNDTETTAKELSVTFTNDTAILKITGSNIHSNSDVDFYKIQLPADYTYLISSRLQDAFQSNDQGYYSLDAKYSSMVGSTETWSSPEDTQVPDFVFTGRDSIYFKVQPFSDGDKGSYSLDIKISRVAGNPALSVSRSSISFNTSEAIEDNFEIASSETNWKITPSVPWINVNTSAGTGNANITITASANGSEFSRSASVTISGNGVLPQTISVEQKGKDLIADGYETNDTETTAHAGNIAFNNNIGCYSTINANIHASTDVDYFKIILPSGNNYSISSILRDAYVSPDFTVDAKISYKIGNNTWSSPEDSKILPFTAPGGTDIYFKVEAYNTGETGTYQMKISAERIPNTLTWSETYLNLAAIASSASFNITSNTSWTITSSETWLTVNPISGSNNGSIKLNATANPNNSARTATVTVTGGGITKTLNVNQNTSFVASLAVSQTTLNVAATANSTTSFNITSNITWTVSSSATWLTPNGSSGINNATINLVATENPTFTGRSATITVTGSGITRTITVTQAATVPTLTTSATTLNVAASANSAVTFNVTSNTSWNASSSQTWLTVGTTSATGNASVILTASANPTINTRTANVTIAGSGITRTITVTQAAGSPTLTISTTTLGVNASANSTNTFGIVSNTSWTVTSSETWLTANNVSGSSNANITLTATANPNTSARTATITISGSGITRTITVTQAAADPALSISETTLNLNSLAGSGTFDINSNVSWTVKSSETWLTTNNASGSNNTNIILSASTNSVTSARTATVTVIGSGITRTITVTQAAADPVLTVSETNLSVNALANSTATFDIHSNTNWTIASSEPWLTASNVSGANNETITLTTTANSTSDVRTGTLTVSGSGIIQTISVTQLPDNVLAVSAATLSISASANSTATFDITSNTSWTITSSETWLALNNLSGANNAGITLTAAANTSAAARTANISITAAGVTKTIIVTQSSNNITGYYNEINDGVKFYPNPVIDKLRLELDDQSAENRVLIYSEKGELKSDKNYHANHFDIEMSDYAAGVYFIRIVNSKESKTIKIVKKN